MEKLDYRFEGGEGADGGEQPPVEEEKVPVEEEKVPVEEEKAPAVVKPTKSVNSIDYSNNPAIKSKCHVTIRIKPLGSGAGDIVHESEKLGNKRLKEFNKDKNEMIFLDEGG